MVILIPLLVMIIGVLGLALSSRGVIQEVSRAAIWTGLLVVQLELAGRTLRLF